MKLKRLNKEFFLDNPDLENALYDKKRGYGIITISFNSLLFAIPLRSNMNPKKGFSTVSYTCPETNQVKYKGLDYQRAVLLFDENRYVGRSFKIPSEEFNKIVDNKDLIQKEFESYVLKYITLYKENKLAQLHREYKDSTLVNYHSDLEIFHND